MGAGTTTRIVPKVGPLPYADIGNPQSINKFQYTLNNPLKFIDPDGHNWQRIEEKDDGGRAIVKYVWNEDPNVKDVPDDYRYLDTQGRVIQLYADANYHGWGVLEPGRGVNSDQPGNGPASFKEYGDTVQALKNAGYEPLRVNILGLRIPDLHPAHWGGFDYAKKADNMLHITIFTKDCCKGGVPARSDEIVRVDAHTDRYSPITSPIKHFTREALPQMIDKLKHPPLLPPILPPVFGPGKN